MKSILIVTIITSALAFSFTAVSCKENGPASKVGDKIDDALDQRPAEKIRDKVEDITK
jgi:hypothetical protein